MGLDRKSGVSMNSIEDTNKVSSIECTILCVIHNHYDE